MESETVLIHVRFAPNGAVVEIGERPAALSPQQWYDRLCEKAGTAYQPLAGGRAVFRLTRAEVDTLKAGGAI
jgi:hypothetical protein